MNVNPLTGLFSGASNQLQRTATRIHNTIASLVTGNRFSQGAQGDVAGLSIAVQLQSQLGVLKSAVGNIAQSISLTQVAAQGVNQQLQIVGRMQQLAAQASNGALDAEARKGLDIEFQGLKEELNRIGANTQFNGQNLLNGDFQLNLDQAFGSDPGEEGSELAPGDLTAAGLFGDQNPSLLTQEGAAAASEALKGAQGTLLSAQANIGSFSESLDYAAASLQSAIFNQDAARAEISDADFADAATQLALANVQRNIQLAVAAQSNKLPPRILDLLQ